MDRRDAAWCEGDAFGSQVVGVRSALEVAEALELAEQVVQGLLADAQPRRELGRPRALWPGVLEDVEVRRVDVVEAALVQRSSMRRCIASQGMRSSAPIIGGPNGCSPSPFS